MRMKLNIKILVIFLFIHNNYCMEMTQSTRNPVQRPNLKDTLPMELITYALQLKYRPVKTIQKNTLANPVLLIPSPFMDKITSTIKLFRYQWLLPVNLNSGTIVDAKKWYLTSMQFHYRYGDDHITKSRYAAKMTLSPHLITKVDGANDDGYCIMAHASHHTMYTIYIAHMTQRCQKRYPKTINQTYPLNDRIYETPYRLQHIGSKFKAAALHKNTNRFVIIDKNKIYLYDILPTQKDNEDSGFEPRLISQCELPAKTNFKRICFLSETTLLSLTLEGEFYSFHVDKDQNIIYNKKTIFEKPDKKTKVLFHNFAVDPCFPSKIVLQTKDKRLFLWNLKNSIFKESMNLTELFDHKKNTALWLYNNTLTPFILVAV